MSQQYPPQPQPPYPPQEPRKRSVGKIAGLGCAGILVLFVVIVIAVAASGGGGSTDDSKKEKAVAGAEKGSANESSAREKSPAERSRTRAEEFQACVAKSGTPTEKAAVKHVTKVTGAEQRNDILDAPEVFTDFSGGLTGPHQGEGKLIASAFASCYESDNGLVTVYGKDGEILANANY
ncbi:hypothetical protein GCM10010269_31650 [Streptomyces humidus]|uniref:Uncharacterized protein n=1 Tax=Streptomyces humidus TaxID=52259 RepID=A0A918L412_9ACTN|nr:hypothetical protein [Streptomyces humidus]GGR90206.1 hypothetical protein GCM10010269_31650 [Streptomyces humidus]